MAGCLLAIYCKVESATGSNRPCAGRGADVHLLGSNKVGKIESEALVRYAKVEVLTKPLAARLYEIYILKIMKLVIVKSRNGFSRAAGLRQAANTLTGGTVYRYK